MRPLKLIASVGLVASSVLLVAAPASAGTTPTPVTFVLTSNDVGTGVLPPATVGHPYAVQLDDGSPLGTDVYTYGASFPQGITASPSGLISGTPELPQTTQTLVISKQPGQHPSVRNELVDLTVSSGVPGLDPVLVPLDTNLIATILIQIPSLLEELEGTLGCLTEIPVRPPCSV